MPAFSAFEVKRKQLPSSLCNTLYTTNQILTLTNTIRICTVLTHPDRNAQVSLRRRIRKNILTPILPRRCRRYATTYLQKTFYFTHATVVPKNTSQFINLHVHILLAIKVERGTLTAFAILSAFTNIILDQHNFRCDMLNAAA